MGLETGGVDWTVVTHVKDQSQALMNTITNLWVQRNARNFLD
jgi:hypothetical protein